MLRKVSIAINAGGYSLVAYVAPESETSVGGEAEQGEGLTVINHQRWQLQEAPFSELVSGQRWDEFNLGARYVEALERAAVASSKLARQLEDRRYSPMFSGFTITIMPGRIDVKVSFNSSLVGEEIVEVVCRYEWDENRQMLPAKFIQGDPSSIPKAFLGDLKEACFGRYGLLARQLERAEAGTTMNPMGEIRWA